MFRRLIFLFNDFFDFSFLLFPSIILCLIIPWSGTACADQVSWVGGASGVWENPANWSNNALPAAGDEVTVAAGIITHASGETVIDTLHMAGTLNLKGGSLTLTGSSSVNGELTVAQGAALIAEGDRANLVVNGEADIGNGEVMALAGARITLPDVTHYQGVGRLRAEGEGSLLELQGVKSVGAELGPSGYLFEAISREYSCFKKQPTEPDDGPTKGVFAAYSREVSGYQDPAVPLEENIVFVAYSREVSGYQHQLVPTEGIFSAYSREISGFHREYVPDEGEEKDVITAYSREISGFNRLYIPAEDDEKRVFSAYSREISGFHLEIGSDGTVEEIVREVISREVSLEHLSSDE